MRRAVIAHSRRVLNGNPLPVMLLHVGENLPHLFPHLVRPLLPGLRLLAGGKIKQPEQAALNPQLIAVSPFPGELIQLPDAGREPLIPLRPRFHLKGHPGPALRQREEKPVRADILPAGHEKLRPENDIFVLHGPALPGSFIYAVQLSRKYEQKLACLKLVPIPIHRHNPPPFFYRDNLHLLVPVDRHPWKVHGNRARINGKGKFPLPVLLSLLKPSRPLLLRNPHRLSSATFDSFVLYYTRILLVFKSIN